METIPESKLVSIKTFSNGIGFKLPDGNKIYMSYEDLKDIFEYLDRSISSSNNTTNSISEDNGIEDATY